MPTEKSLRESLLELHRSGNSWRKIAALREYGNGEISHATLRRYAYGAPIVNREHRRILDIVEYPRSARPRKLEIHKDDPRKAALSIINKIDRRYIIKLHQYLTEWLNDEI